MAQGSHTPGAHKGCGLVNHAPAEATRQGDNTSLKIQPAHVHVCSVLTINEDIML
jgi:hypothetical protein